MDLSSSHPHRILQGIQAEVLLSYYYLTHGKVLGGNYHANAAVSLSLSSGLHRIRRAEPSSSAPPPLSSPRLPLKLVDDTEEGERVDAFWAVLVLNNTWIAIQESYSMFYDLQTIGVDTPWPMDALEYQLQLLPSVSSGTIKGFLNSTSIEGFSILALHAKAAVLLEQATVYASNPDEIEGTISDKAPTTEFSRIETMIEQFKSQLLLVDHMEVKPSETDTLIMIQLMTHAATIKLHFPFVERNPRSREKSLEAAQAIAVLTHNLRSSSSIRIDPIVGVSVPNFFMVTPPSHFDSPQILWTAACDVFMDELKRPDSVTTGNNPQWSTLLHSILSQMDKFSANNPFMKFLVTRLQKNHSAALAFW
ncbi:hypothetical protein C0991_004003 [Blastosporella zonata]|nr:hypothetical protein C0991_004003 [Blastosporella zonata]